MTLLAILLALLALALAGLVLFTAYTARRVEAALPPRGKFLDVEGARLHYLETGDGPPLMMIHGLGGQMGHYTYGLVDQLKRDFRIVVIDRPGSGYSLRQPGSSAAIRAQGEVVAQAIARLKLDRPLLVGHSMGGAIALAVALDHPDRIGGLALIAPLTRPVAQTPEPFKPLAIRSAWARWLISWTVAIPLSIRRSGEMLAAVFGPDPVPGDYAWRGGGLLSLRPGAFRGASLDLVSANTDLRGMADRYCGLTVPVAILYSTEDSVLDYRAHGLAMRDVLPSAEPELTDGGHMLPITAPEKCAAFIRRAAERAFAPAPMQAEI